MTAKPSPEQPSDFSAEYTKLKKERDKRYEERVRWETELNTVERQIQEVEKKIRDELGIEPDQLEARVRELSDEATKIVKKIEELLKPNKAE